MSHRGPDGGPVPIYIAGDEGLEASGPSPSPVDPEQARIAAAEWARWESNLGAGNGLCSPARSARESGLIIDSPSKRARVGTEGDGQNNFEDDERMLFGPEEGRQEGSPVPTEAGSSVATERADSIEGTAPFVGSFDPEARAPRTPPAAESSPAPNDFASILNLQMSKVMIEVTSNINKQISVEMEKVMTAFSTSASEQNQKVEELKDTVTVVERKVDIKLKNYEKNLKLIEAKSEKRAKDQKVEFQQQIDKMNENVKSLREDLEKKGNSSSSRPSTDPLMQNDPWARANSARTELRSGPPPRVDEPSSRSSDSRTPTFKSYTPKALHLKGWSLFKDSRGLNSNDAKALGGRIVDHLPADLRAMIAAVRAPYVLNHRIVQELTVADWALCMKMKEAINDIIVTKNIHTMGSDNNIRCIVAPSPELASRNRTVARALGTLEKHLTYDFLLFVKTDWKAATVYKLDNLDSSSPVHTIIGKIRGSEWAWLGEPLTLCFPSVEFESLVGDTAAAMAE